MTTPPPTTPADAYDRLRDALQRYVDGDDCEYGDGPPCPGDPPYVEICVYCQACKARAEIDALLYSAPKGQP